MPSDDNDRRLTANHFLSKRKVIFLNFIGGISWGIGSVIGASIIVAIILGLAQAFNFIPGFNNLLEQVVQSDREKQLQTVRENLRR